VINNNIVSNVVQARIRKTATITQLRMVLRSKMILKTNRVNPFKDQTTITILLDQWLVPCQVAQIPVDQARLLTRRRAAQRNDPETVQLEAMTTIDVNIQMFVKWFVIRSCVL
jgi:inosine-uridine nucleoside N-ribohydrolase